MLHIGRDAVLAACYVSGVSAVYGRLPGRRSGVLTYHNVLPRSVMGAEYPFRVDVAAEVFERQLDFLRSRWRILPAAEYEVPREGFLLTFDDGMRNAFTVVAPILERRGLTGVFAVCPGLVEGEIPHLWRDHLYLILREARGRSLLLPFDGYRSPVPVAEGHVDALGEGLRAWVVSQRVRDVYGMVREICERNAIPYRRHDHLPERFHPLCWERAAQMVAAGHVVVSHTWSHRILQFLSREEKRWEMATAREALRSRLGVAGECIVYPYGGPAEVDVEALEVAAECGYTTGFLNVRDTLGGEPRMARARFGLPPTAFRPHLHAAVTGFKDALLRRS